MSVIDKYRFESRSAGGCSDSDYHLHMTSCCDRFCVEDDELCELYLDPGDLSKWMSLWRDGSDTSPLSCPFCGAADWDLVEVQELALVPASWQWACWRR